MSSIQSTMTRGSVVALLFGVVVASGYRANELQQRSTKPQSSRNTLDDVRSTLKDAKRALAREGKCACCISPSCDFCAFSVDRCPCNENLSKGKPVCHECRGGWQAGFGIVEGVNPADVKALPGEMSKMMYDQRAKKYLKKR